MTTNRRLRAHRQPTPATIAVSLLAMLAILVAACGGGSGAGGTPGPTGRDLDGTSWRSILIRDVPPVVDAPATLTFTGKQAGGTTGCNSYGGTFTLDADGAFTFGAMMMTEMACNGPRGIQEGVVVDVLSHADHLEITADGNLRITGTAGSIVFSEAPR